MKSFAFASRWEKKKKKKKKKKKEKKSGSGGRRIDFVKRSKWKTFARGTLLNGMEFTILHFVSAFSTVLPSPPGLFVGVVSFKLEAFANNFLRFASCTRFSCISLGFC